MVDRCHHLSLPHREVETIQDLYRLSDELKVRLPLRTEEQGTERLLCNNLTEVHLLLSYRIVIISIVEVSLSGHFSILPNRHLTFLPFHQVHPRLPQTELLIEMIDDPTTRSVLLQHQTTLQDLLQIIENRIPVRLLLPVDPLRRHTTKEDDQPTMMSEEVLHLHLKLEEGDESKLE